ncbi:DUF6092 family protein [Planomicrobium sp. CPCC 101079]|uniref:DUF6092 family protein n=1 Tax=Planomicrobium sp. CPCC 101079 TaxID=2599618 RepID=UPI0011B5541F|nr:DUF6092 family protein [Planomicrobium sp. CPCC 101079]TWT03636.1 hypothetical protein FQV28_11495 [Planomicrobium sp. CPCC 101079]
MTNTKDENLAKEHLLDFVGYVLTSTRGLYREPQSYGPMRMIDTLEKALMLLKEQGLEEESLDQIMGILRENRWKVTADPEAYALAIDEAIQHLVTVTLQEKD